MPKKFLVGLGNPGDKYQFSRHNLGFQYLDYLQQQLQLTSFQLKKKLESEISSNQDLLLIKPQTFMNLSGQAVWKVLKFSNPSGAFAADRSIFQADWLEKALWVVHDDLDLELGHFKIQLGTGPKQHNGLLSLYQHLGSDRFWHIRIGCDDRQGMRNIPPEQYVLQPFSSVQILVARQLFVILTQKLVQIGLLNTN